MHDQSQVERLVSAARDAVESDAVLRVTQHFAGYFNELGITIALKAETSNERMLILKDKAAAALLQYQVPFLWMVIFEREGKQVGVLFSDGFFAH